ncbi:porin [Aquabacter sp. L1I39]|uniref:porin n=1 Tax=Aquabacter sp. L1I39 TaxID=2820278 RepID=UPI001ADA42F1|nr:porin [Aquabacter sp. L1I39]QTL05741.1 porin [Aquabacter sp. L1I39]
MRRRGLGLALLAGVASTAATAADLPVKAAGATYVRQCTAEGPGFYYVPGSDTCLRIGGYTWAEGYYNTYTDYPSSNNKTYSIATFGLQVDSRTQTEYGTLRAYMDVRLRWRTSDMFSDGPNKAEADPWNIYIQFAGFTFGYAQSFFDFYANANVMGTDPATIGDDTRITLAGYTWELPNGFIAKASLEDASVRNSGISPSDPAWPGVTDNYQTGARMPEFVAAFGQEGKWGQWQLSGALHQVVASTTADFLGSTTTSWGYALQAGVMFNLPFLGEGDNLYLQSAYVDGAVSYLGLNNPSGEFEPPDAYINANGSLSRVSGWNLVGQLLHNWNDKWNSALFGGYARFDLNDPTAEIAYGATSGTNYNVGANLTWVPVEPLAITLQYDYNVWQANGYVDTGYGLPVSSQKAHQVLLMFARTF